MSVATLENKDIYSSVSDSLLERHYQELKESAIDDEIIRLNFRSVEDDNEAHRILNKRKERKWNNPSPYVPAWMCSGIDPLTSESSLQGVQLKLDNPYTNEKGKIIKYESPRKIAPAPLFLRHREWDFWEKIIKDISYPIIITEGAKKAGALISLGYAAISIPGVSTCAKLARLHQNLDLFAKVGRKVYICFDNDILYKESVKKALIKLSGLFQSSGAICYLILIPEGTAKGCDDYIKQFGSDNFNSLVENAITVQEWVEETKEADFEKEEQKNNSKLAKYYSIIEEAWGEELRFNTLSKEVELFGKELDEDEVRLIMAIKFGIDVPKSDALSIVSAIAKKQSYSPVCEYLDEVAVKHKDIDPSILDNLAEKYFGTKDPLHQIYLKRFLVGAVERARRPGCRKQEVLMLVSPKQGKFKSTFFEVLFGSKFFTDQLGSDISSKDEKMKISQYWCLEWAEFENVYRKKDVSTLKNFITNPTDTFRAPYDRKDRKHPRPCVFVGTSNLIDILHDPTGDRRFWIIEVLKKIPIDLVQADRDKIWAAADKLYQEGFQIYLTDEEEELREIDNKKFRASTAWDEEIESYWKSEGCPNFLPTKEIRKILGFETAKEFRAKEQAELTAAMTRLGFRGNEVGRFNGISCRGWKKIDVETDDKNKKSDVTGVTGVTTPESIDIHSIPNVTPPVTPPVTGVTSKDLEVKNTDTVDGIKNINVTPVTPHVTPPVTAQNVDISTTPSTVTPVTLQSSENKNIESNLDNSVSTETVHPQKTIPTTGDFVYLPSGKIDKIKARVGDSAVFEESKEFIPYAHLDIADFESNLELLRQCICDKDYDQVAELTSMWCESYKVEMREKLTPHEKSILTKLRTQKQATEKSRNRLPVIKSGERYWIKGANQEGTVQLMIDTNNSCSVLISKPKGSYTFTFDDIEALPDSPTLEINVGDKVEVLEGKYRGTSGCKVSSILGNRIFLKTSGGTKIKLGHPFYAHQLKVMSS